MYGCYVEVVFHFVAKAILFLCFFGFDIYPYILFHFFLNVFYYSCIYIGLTLRGALSDFSVHPLLHISCDGIKSSSTYPSIGSRK